MNFSPTLLSRMSTSQKCGLSVSKPIGTVETLYVAGFVKSSTTLVLRLVEPFVTLLIL